MTGRREWSRRAILGAGVLAVGSALAGCLGEDDSDREPLGLDISALQEIGERETPSESTLPVELTDDHLTSQRDETEALLDPVSEADISTLQNELVREDLLELLDRARGQLREFDDTPPAEREFSDIRRARAAAAEARGGFDAAIADRTYDDAMADADAVEAELTTWAESLERNGEAAAEALVVYNEIEQHVDSGIQEFERLARLSRAASAVEAASRSDRHTETARSEFAAATHLAEQYDGDREFSEKFEAGANALLDSLEAELADFPDAENRFEDFADEFFEETVEETPREQVVSVARSIQQTGEQLTTLLLEKGLVARALFRTYTLSRDIRAVKALTDRSAEGELDRPESATEIADLREEAIDETETQLESADGDPLVEAALIDVIGGVRFADEELQGVQHTRHDERDILWATGRYAISSERARAVPDARSELQSALEE